MSVTFSFGLLHPMKIGRKRKEKTGDEHKVVS